MTRTDSRHVMLESLEPRLLLAGDIAGQVVDFQTGAPLANMWVDVGRGSDPNRANFDDFWWVTSVQTDSQGRFLATGLDACHYALQVQDGQQAGGKRYTAGYLVNIEVVDGMTSANNNVAVRQAGRLFGYVYDSTTLAPIANAELVVELGFTEDEYASSDWHMAWTDASGQYNFYLPPTSRAIYPVKVLQASAGTVHYAVQIAPTLYSAAVSGTRGPDFYLTEGATIHGFVTNPLGDPLPYVDVLEPYALIPGGVFEDPNVWTDINGEYWLRGVPTGVDVYLETIDWDWHRLQYAGPPCAWGGRWLGPFNLSPGQTLDLPTLIVPLAGSISGVVTDESGRPVPGVEIKLQGVDVLGGAIDMEHRNGGFTDAAGRFTIPAVPPGKVTIRATREGYLDYVGAEVVAILSGQEVVQHIVLCPASLGVVVSGKISNFSQIAPKNSAGVILPFGMNNCYEDYGIVRELGIAAFDASRVFTPTDLLNVSRFFTGDAGVEDGYDDYFVPSKTEVGGTFRMTLPAGPQTIIAYRDCPGIDVAGAGGGLLSNPVTVNGVPGGTISGLKLSIPTGTSKLRGQVYFPAGHPGVVSTDTVTIILRQVSGAHPDFGRAVASPGPSGQYVIPDLPAGQYYLYVVAEGLKPFQSATFALAKGQTLIRDIYFDWGAVVSGVVTSGGQPLAGVTVTSTGTGLAMVTAADGTYTLTGLPDGPDILRAAKPGYFAKTSSGTFVSGSPAVVDFDLARDIVTGSFAVDVDWLYYQDVASREIAYDFSSGTMDSQGVLTIPGSAVLNQPQPEMGAAYLWAPGSGSQQQLLDMTAGVYSLSVPRPADILRLIPTADIAIDGSAWDWVPVAACVNDADGEFIRWGGAGADVDLVKLAYSPDQSTLNLLWKMNGPADPSVNYDLFLDRHLDGHTTDYLIRIRYYGDQWIIETQWNDGGSGPGAWHSLEAGGLLAVNDSIIEASVLAQPFGLPGATNAFGGTGLDQFDTCFNSVEGCSSLISTGPLAPAADDWTFAARLKNFRGCEPTLAHSGVRYETSIGAWGDAVVSPEIDASWFVGTCQGVFYENPILILEAGIESASGYDWEWGGGTGNGLVLTGYDPATAVVDLKVEVSGGGQTVTFYYRVNSLSADQYGTDWVLLTSHTLPNGVGAMTGFPAGVPEVSVGVEYHDEGYDTRGLLCGDWAITSLFGRGTIQFDGNGGVTGGDFTDHEGSSGSFTGGYYRVEPDGTITMRVQSDSLVHPVVDLSGAVNAAGDMVTLTTWGRPTPTGEGDLLFLTRHMGAFSNADLAGQWRLAGVYTRGSILFDGAGGILGGDFVDGDGSGGRILGGTYAVADNGTVTMTVTSESENPVIYLTGWLNDSKDVLVANEDPPSTSFYEDQGLFVATRHDGRFVTTDLFGSWHLLASCGSAYFGPVNGLVGDIVFNGAGRISGGRFTDRDGNQWRVTGGSYTVAPDGTVSVVLTTTDPDIPTLRAVGTLNSSRDMLALTDTRRLAETSGDEYLLVLVNSLAPDLAASFTSMSTPSPSVPGDRWRAVVRVVNLGQVAAAGSITVRLYASLDQTLDEGDRLLQEFANQPVGLAMNQSRLFNFDVVVPADLPPGGYYLLAEVNPEAITDGDWTNNVAVAGPCPVVWQFGQVGSRRRVTLVVAEPDGTLAVFPLSGPGTGQVIPSPGGWDLAFTGTDASSACEITTRRTAVPGDDGYLDLVNVTINGSMGSLFSRYTDIFGDMTITGTIRTLVFDDIYGPSVLTIGGATAAIKAVSIRFDDVFNLAILSGSPIASLMVTQWEDNPAWPSVVQAPWIGALTVTGRRPDPLRPWRAVLPGDFMADLVLTGTDSRGFSLTLLDVEGALLGAQVRCTGSIGAVEVGAMVGSVVFAGVSPSVTGLPILAADFQTQRTIGRLIVWGMPGLGDWFADSQVAAWALGDITIQDVQMYNAGAGHGLAGHTLGRYRRFQDSLRVFPPPGSTVRWPAVGPQVVEQADDFVVRVV